MKITGIRTVGLRYRYDSPIADGCNRCGNREAFLLFLDTDEGITGIGEAAAFGNSLIAMKEIVRSQIWPLLEGEDPQNINYIWNKLLWSMYAGGRKGLVRGLSSAVDLALWDIAGKVKDQPLYRLLGGDSNVVNSYASGGFYQEGKDIDSLRYELEGYLNEGYQAFKIKVGRTDDQHNHLLSYMPNKKDALIYEEDLDRIRIARQVIGEDKCLMLDFNNVWQSQEVLDAAGFLREMKIYALEEVIPVDDFDGFRKIRESIPGILLAGGENEQGQERYRQLLREDALDIVQSNLGWSGGITEVRRIADLAGSYGKFFSPHSFCSGVLLTANLHLAAALPNVPFVESEENSNPLRTELIKDSFERDKNMSFILSERPGLGIELNEETIKKYQFI